MSKAKETATPIPGTPAARRRQRPMVLVNRLWGEALRHAILELGHEFGWELIDLDMLRGAIPADPAPRGALLTGLSHAHYQQLRTAGIPLVEFVRVSASFPSAWPVVGMDQVAQGRLAADHFAERGFRHLAFVGHDPWANSRPLYDGFRERASERGVACEPYQLKSTPPGQPLSPAQFRRRERQLGDWLRGQPKPVGVLTYSDQRARMLCVTAMSAELAVPEEVAILGRGNDLYACEVSPVMLSSIDVDMREMGLQAARLLQRVMQGAPEPEEPILIPPSGIVERQSTDVLATPDPDVAAALRYMWDHLDLDLSVNGIANEVGVPRHRLERAFRRYLDRGINEELRRKRLEVFRRLLATTDVPIAELAPSVGFRSMVHLRRSFRGAYGMSAREYRAARRVAD